MNNETGVLCIRMLRDAELSGQQVIAGARERRQKKMKEAKFAAQLDVDEFRKECEADFNRKRDQIALVDSVLDADVTKKYDNELERINSRFEACSSHVVELLEKLTCHVEPQMHYNFGVRKQIEANDAYTSVDFGCDKYVGSLVDACVQKCELIAASLHLDTNDNNNNNSYESTA